MTTGVGQNQLGLILLMLLSSSAQAGVITSVSPGSTRLPRSAPVHNDDADKDSGHQFRLSWSQDNTQPRVFAVVVTNSASTDGSVNEYFASLVIDNQSGVNWSGIRLELGFDDAGDFQAAPDAIGLDFDWPDRTGYFDWLNLNDGLDPTLHDPTKVAWLGQSQRALAGSNNVWAAIDVPDYQPSMPDFARRLDGSGAVIGYTFALRITPQAVPEPAASGVFAAAMLLPRRRRRRQ